MSRPRILSISFSPLVTDARVQRQLAVLAEHGELTTVGYGPELAVADRHIQVPDDAASLPETPGGVVRLALRRHRDIELRAPGERAVLAEVDAAGPWDLVVANDARAFPLAFRAAGSAPVWADLHEWAPQENWNSTPWRLLISPYMDALCRRYLPLAAATTTVGTKIAELYAERYGIVEPALVRNAGPFQELAPSPPAEGRIRLVHSGIGVPERNVEALIDAVHALDDRFTLDLYLIGKEPYLESLRQRAGGSARIRFRDPVKTTELPTTLNAYDLGVYLLQVRSLNHRLMMPNKFFDFVQARLGIVMTPAVETSALTREYGLGPILPDARLESLIEALRSIRPEQIADYKRNADAAAHSLSSEADLATMRGIVGDLLERSSR